MNDVEREIMKLEEELAQTGMRLRGQETYGAGGGKAGSDILGGYSQVQIEFKL